jgi:alkyldihydroxyacetonephosphate synthase
MDIPNLRWWGWGTSDQSYDLSNRPGFWPFMQANLGVGPGPLAEPVPLDAIMLPPPRLDAEVLGSLQKKLDATVVNTSHEMRVLHAYGKSYKDLVRLRRGEVPHPPDAVVFPESEAQVVELLAWATQHGAVLVPFGGGSSVTSGVEPHSESPVITVDLARLSQVIRMDATSQTVTAQAGILGPALECAVGAQGFSLGHFPQSFEFSTLGGWIATRSAGQTSIGYGKIEEMIEAVRVVTPVGTIETRPVPASAAGPSLLQSLVGSEGAFGVITQATVRLHRKPEVSDYRGVMFRRFEDGMAAVRDIMQGGADVVMARLSDGPETAASLALNRAPHSPFSALITNVGMRVLKVQGYNLAGQSCLMILGVEGKHTHVSHNVRAALRICQRHGGFDLGRSVGAAWLRERFALPYLRDTFLGRGLMVDTLETATTWDNLPQLYTALTDALRQAIAAGNVQPYAMTHVSHAYTDGASLYSTFLGKQVPGREIEQWWAVKRAATEAILSNGGTLSHHHGVGVDHASWLERELGVLGMQALGALKITFDPQSAMNPGVLLSSQIQVPSVTSVDMQ